MLPVRWRPEALDDLLGIVAYIGQSDEAAALRFKSRIEAAILPLSDHPYLFRPDRRAGTRELVAHPNYIVVYRVLDEAIDIVSVLHVRREYP